jgi:hypothetical protein
VATRERSVTVDVFRVPSPAYLVRLTLGVGIAAAPSADLFEAELRQALGEPYAFVVSRFAPEREASDRYNAVPERRHGDPNRRAATEASSLQRRRLLQGAAGNAGASGSTVVEFAVRSTATLAFVAASDLLLLYRAQLLNLTHVSSAGVPSSSESAGSSAGATVGVAVGGALAAAVVALVVLGVLRSRHRKVLAVPTPAPVVEAPLGLYSNPLLRLAEMQEVEAYSSGYGRGKGVACLVVSQAGV